MRRYIISFIVLTLFSPVLAQQMLTLEKCRELALENNKQLNIGRLKQEMAVNTRKAVRTKYLPKVDAVGGYEYFSKEVSLLSNSQKSALSNLGTNAGTNVSQTIINLAQQGIITPETAQQLGGLLTKYGNPLIELGNKIGDNIKEAFRTDTKNIWVGTVILRQPIYMGGAITAANRLADINELMAGNDIDLRKQNTLYDIDKAYWLVVSLKQKQKLAESYRDLVKKLDDDVCKMIKEGIATRADGLRVDVKVNEAEMQVTQVDNGLSLAKMLLCQLCGLPMDDSITLVDEDRDDLQETDIIYYEKENAAYNNRPEVRMLENAIDMSREATKIVRAAYLPQVALTGGYTISNPNVFNGFERKFSGVWSVGLMVHVPVWNWFEGKYKVNASKAATTIAEMELSDVREKINLQVTQDRYKVNEAHKRLAMAENNIKSAEENLRCADVGFKEGVMDATDVMAAQTAWQQALSQKIDAEIDVKLTQVSLKKSLGILE